MGEGGSNGPDAALLAKKKRHQVNVGHVFKVQRKTIIWAVIFELLICLSFTEWGKIGGETSKEEAAIFKLRMAFWCTFAGCIALRGLIVGIWQTGRGHQCVWAGLYMFFSSIQFVLYMAYYYRMSDKLSIPVMTANPQTSVSLDPSTHKFAQMCGMVYNSTKCDGHEAIPGDNGAIDCCVIVTGALTHAVNEIPHVHVGIPTAFSLLLWLTIMVLSWIWMNAPLVTFTPDDKDFIANVWLEVLDCAVFGQYILHAAVQYPAFGLVGFGSEKGRLCSNATVGGECDTMLHDYIWICWLVAFVTTLLTPTLYTMFKFLNKDKEQNRSLDDAIVDLNHSVKVLARKKSAHHLEEALHMQLDVYHDADSEDEEHTVKVGVYDKEESSKRIGDRRGFATMNLPEDNKREAERNYGKYTVTFHDAKKDEEPVIVPVKDLELDFEEHKKMCGKKCCHGWMRCKYLNPQRKHKLDAFERRAKWLNAVRTLVLLEFPFLCFRFYFDIVLGGSVSIMFLKNLIWCCIHVMLLFSCGNDAATCLQMTPIRSIMSTIKGTKLSTVFIAPAAMFQVAAQVYEARLSLGIQSQIADLEGHKAWLMCERRKGKDAGLDTTAYKNEYHKMDKKIDELSARAAEIHM